MGKWGTLGLGSGEERASELADEVARGLSISFFPVHIFYFFSFHCGEPA
jgi:hypothetical protein